jgi:hypothetical protein
LCTTDGFSLTFGNNKACFRSSQMNLIEIGNIINEEQVNGIKAWKQETTDLSNVYLYLFNNYWHTNFKAYQSGLLLYTIDLWIE